MSDSAQLFALCKRGNKSELHKFARSKGKNVVLDSRTTDNQTCLHVACENGKEEIVAFLLEKYKLDVNAVDTNGWTPLHSACKVGNTKIIKLLLSHGAFARPLTNEGSSPLHYFVRNECTDDKEFNDIITTLVKKGCTVNLQNQHGEVPLHQAAMRGKHYCLLILLNNGAEANQVTRHGETALHFAVRGGHKESVTILLQFGADPFIKAKSGTIFAAASKFRQPSMRNLLRDHLLSQGADLPPELESTATADAAATRSKKKAAAAPNDSGADDGDEKRKLDPKDPKKKKSRAAYKKVKEGRGNRSSTVMRSSAEQDVDKKKVSISSTEKEASSSPARQRSQSNAAQAQSAIQQPTAPSGDEEDPAESLGERIERLKNRVRDKEKPTSPGPSRKSVIALAKSFEGASPGGEEDFSSRIEKLKQNVSSVINVDSIESEVSRSSSSMDMVEKGIKGCQMDPSEVKNRYLLAKLKDEWKCKVCKKAYSDEVPLTFFSGNPHDYEELSTEAKKSRAKVSSDLCSIDNQRFYVRGLVELPLLDTPTDGETGKKNKTSPFSNIKLIWGVWVQVDAQEFFKIMEKWTEDVELSLTGVINNIMQPYPDVLNQPVSLRTRAGGLRPLVTLENHDHLLAVEQRDGITFKRLETLVESVLHEAPHKASD